MLLARHVLLIFQGRWHSHPHILGSKIERDNVNITVEMEVKLEWEGDDRRGGKTHRAWVGVVCWEFAGERALGYTMTNGRINTRRQLLGGVVGMLAGMNGPSCSKLASLSTSMVGLLQPGNEDVPIDSVKLKSKKGSRGGAY